MNAARMLRVFPAGMLLGAALQAEEDVRWVERNGDADCLELGNATARVVLGPHRGEVDPGSWTRVSALSLPRLSAARRGVPGGILTNPGRFWIGKRQAHVSERPAGGHKRGRNLIVNL